jgi:hypothetical protein
VPDPALAGERLLDDVLSRRMADAIDLALFE